MVGLCRAIYHASKRLMASKSRAAQERLAELEKTSAPFEDQLLEAARFIGIRLEDVGRSPMQLSDSERKRKAVGCHGKEEWLLRWLLKKLQAPEDDVPRKTPSSWRIFCHLLQVIPLTSTSRLLNERKFMTILRHTLEEAEEVVHKTFQDLTDDTNRSISSSADNFQSSNVSKKRKRTGELVAPAIYHMLQFTKVTSGGFEKGLIAAVSTEYMKSVIRTTAEEAAKILGSWLFLCRKNLKVYGTLNAEESGLWLSPFIEIWDLHKTGNEDLMDFSLYCSQHLLSLLKMMHGGDDFVAWKGQLEQLVARNIVIPARAAEVDNPDSNLLSRLTRVSVIKDSANAPILFEVAIRSLQTHESQRRRPSDSAWLQTVFTKLKEALPPQRANDNGKAVCSMLQSAIDYGVDVDVSALRSVASEYALPENYTNWILLATMVKLDANLFLIAGDAEDLLQAVFTRITTASMEPTWLDLSYLVVSDVVVPLMSEFAKARDLSGFIRHWYSQLVEFERIRKNSLPFVMSVFGAWEDAALQMRLSKLMEASMTVQQIVQILDWLSSQVARCPDAVCVILEAIAGSVTREDVVDAVGNRIFHIMFDNDASETLDCRYRWRSWKILSRTMKWTTATGMEEISKFWDEYVKPGGSLTSRLGKGNFFEPFSRNAVKLEIPEILRCGCAALDAAKKETPMEDLSRSFIRNLLQRLTEEIKLLLQDLRGGRELGKEKCGSTLNTLYRGIGWILWSCVQCVFTEYPSVLEIGFELKDDLFRDLLQSIFWIASFPKQKISYDDSNVWIRINGDAFSNLWISILNNDQILNTPTLIGQIIDIMLCCESHLDNPLVKSSTNNAFAVQCLLQLPLEIFSKRNRYRVMIGWRQSPKAPEEDNSEIFSCDSGTLDPAVLSLKVKMLQRPISYEGMKYQDLRYLADALATANTLGLDVTIRLFKELARLTFLHTAVNLHQPRNRAYILEALGHLQINSKTQGDDEKHKLNYALVVLFEALLEVLAVKDTSLEHLDVFGSSDLTRVKKSFQKSLLTQLQNVLHEHERFSENTKDSEKSLTILCTINALAALEIGAYELAKIYDGAKNFAASLDETHVDLRIRLDAFMLTLTRSTEGGFVVSRLGGDTATMCGRESIREKVRALTATKDQHTNVQLLESILGDNVVDLTSLENLWAIRHVIVACEDSRRPDDKSREEGSFDLSTAHSVLCGHLWKSTGLRQFCLLSETIEMMLRTKGRAMSQWTIDNTLSCIVIICSRNGPPLRSARAGTIYLHLCHLMHAVLTSHRLKLQGRFHLVVQVMQCLLRCLFTPLPHANSKMKKLLNPPPPWLSPLKDQLRATHASAYTRLITLICDPSVSSVTRSQHNNLTSATDKAKRVAGQHMQFLLTTYIKLQLEMKMLPEVRDKMVPGLYAIFDTTTPEMRRMIDDGLDSSGRALFGGLFKDYQRFGKWRGS